MCEILQCVYVLHSAMHKPSPQQALLYMLRGSGPGPDPGTPLYNGYKLKDHVITVACPSCQLAADYTGESMHEADEISA